MTIEERLKEIIRMQSNQIELLVEENRELKKQLGIDENNQSMEELANAD